MTANQTNDQLDFLTPTDLKQYGYCPRVLFFERCWPDFRPRTYKMEVGLDAHENETKLAARRTLGKLGLENGERRFDVRLFSERLRLHGIVDEIIVTPAAAYPIDYKLARQASPQYQLQLATYSLLIEDQWQLPAPVGYLWLISQRKAERVMLDGALREQAYAMLNEMRLIIEQEMMPVPTSRRAKCRDCEFRRVCNDV
jgi:CRISPR-associated exonuclease Cas4